MLCYFEKLKNWEIENFQRFKGAIRALELISECLDLWIENVLIFKNY